MCMPEKLFWQDFQTSQKKSEMVDIVEVKSRKDLKRFIDFPHKLYSGDKNYVPELYVVQKALFNKKKYPFFRHSKATFYLGIKDHKVAGRIVAIRNNNYIKFSGEPIGFFGFFDAINDYEVAEALLSTTAEWLKQEGCHSMVGPENYTVNDSCGILTEGFEFPPVIGMPYNKPYYSELLEKFGLTKKINLVAYHFPSNKTPPNLQKNLLIAEKMIRDSGIVVRPIDMKNLDREIVKFRDAYNEAFSNNWGFVPMTLEEFSYQAKNLKKVADPEMVLIAERKNEIIGFVITLPNINQTLIKIKNGRLFPTGLLKLLYYKNKIDGCRISILGIAEQYREMGIAAYLYAKVFEMTRKKNISWAEASYVMEDNKIMNRNMKSIGGRIYKRYCIYEKAI